MGRAGLGWTCAIFLLFHGSTMGLQHGIEHCNNKKACS